MNNSADNIAIKNVQITICVPTYNHEAYIRESLDSILSQDVKKIQIIVADDGSVDKTPQIIQEYKTKFPTIFDIILHATNIGVEKNVSSIYPLIKGKYVCWFAGDDAFLPNKLQKQLAYMESNPSCVFCYHDVWVTDRSTGLKYRFNNPIIGKAAYSGNITENLIVDRCFIAMSSVMVRRRFAENISHQHILKGISSDWLYAIELSMLGPVQFIEDVLSIYYRHDNNLTRQSVSHENEEAIYKFLEKTYGHKFDRSIQKGRSILYINYIMKYFFLKRYKEAYHLIVKLKKQYKLSKLLTLFGFAQLPLLIIKHILLWFKTKNIFR